MWLGRLVGQTAHTHMHMHMHMHMRTCRHADLPICRARLNGQRDDQLHQRSHLLTPTGLDRQDRSDQYRRHWRVCNRSNRFSFVVHTDRKRHPSEKSRHCEADAKRPASAERVHCESWTLHRCPPSPRACPMSSSLGWGTLAQLEVMDQVVRTRSMAVRALGPGVHNGCDRDFGVLCPFIGCQPRGR